MTRRILPAFGAAPAAWSPLSEGSLAFWLDPTNNSKITKNGSDQVSQWVDSSSNAHTWAQATDAQKPVVTASAINSLQAMQMGASVNMVGPADRFTATNAAWTFAFAGKIGYSNHYATFLIFSPGGGVPGLIVAFGDSGETGYQGLNLGINDSSYALCRYNANIAGNTVFKAIITFTGSDPTNTASYEIWYNGVSQTVTTNSGGWNAVNTIAGTVIGATGGMATYGNTSFLGDVMFFDAKDATLTSNINTYLSRWGV